MAPLDRDTCRRISDAVGLDPERSKFRTVAGGDIAASFRFDDGDRSVFVKCLAAAEHDLLESERDGLSRIAETNTIEVPAVLESGCDEVAWLALEYVELARPTNAASADLGERLAALHASRGDRFGLERDNYIGRTPQINTPESDWTVFFFEHRIAPQLRRLAEAGLQFGEHDVERLRAAWTHQFAGYAPEPSLIHGDLWVGNAAMAPDGRPLIYDPAVHYADRECDLAMTRLFGGFGSPFYEAYDRAWPLDDGWQERLAYYQLYHVLNHANLFGGGYTSRSRRLIEQLAGA